jgi:transcriptional regulatory protein LEU3
MILAFHFFSAPSVERTSGILQMYFISCDLIGAASRLDEHRDFANHSTRCQSRVISFAAVCILRVHRSSLREQLNTEIGEAMFFEVIRMTKKRSIQNNDLDARTAIILTQLWSSTRLFKFKDGSIDGLRVLLRGRLVRLLPILLWLY